MQDVCCKPWGNPFVLAKLALFVLHPPEKNFWTPLVKYGQRLGGDFCAAQNGDTWSKMRQFWAILADLKITIMVKLSFFVQLPKKWGVAWV